MKRHELVKALDRARPSRKPCAFSPSDVRDALNETDARLANIECVVKALLELIKRREEFEENYEPICYLTNHAEDLVAAAQAAVDRGLRRDTEGAAP